MELIDYDDGETRTFSLNSYKHGRVKEALNRKSISGLSVDLNLLSCTQCFKCLTACPVNMFDFVKGNVCVDNDVLCEKGCEKCLNLCKAISKCVKVWI